MQHHEVRPYIDHLANALANKGIRVAHIRIDTPEQAAELGREWACIDLAGEHARYSLVWSDWRGWMVSTHADHYPLLEGDPCPATRDVASGAASHIHRLRHGAHLRKAA